MGEQITVAEHCRMLLEESVLSIGSQQVLLRLVSLQKALGSFNLIFVKLIE